MAETDLINLLLLPLALGLLGFIEPCSIGSSLLFVKYVERRSASAKVTQAIVFTLRQDPIELGETARSGLH